MTWASGRLAPLEGRSKHPTSNGSPTTDSATTCTIQPRFVLPPGLRSLQDAITIPLPAESSQSLQPATRVTNSLVPKSAGSVGAVLRENGYNTSWFGKMHNVPDWMSSQAGPFDLWPNGLGFEYFYGFLGGDSDQWHPALYENTKPIEPYFGNPDYILDVDLADKAIAWMRMQHALAPNKPWLLYYATGTAHAPHHAPKDWIAKYKGQFDQGWDKVREETLARQIKLGVV